MTNFQETMSGIDTEVTFSKAFISQISSQMIKLKKQNLTYREKIKNMAILIQDGMRQNIDLETLINSKRPAQNGSKMVRYTVKHTGGVLSELEGDKENGYASGTRLSYQSNPFG